MWKREKRPRKTLGVGEFWNLLSLFVFTDVFLVSFLGGEAEKDAKDGALMDFSSCFLLRQMSKWD